MANFYTATRRDPVNCSSDEFCVCIICMLNKSNGGSCNTCSNCTNGSRLEDTEVPCFKALKSVLSMSR